MASSTVKKLPPVPSMRLTNQMRMNILNRLLADKFDARRKAVEKSKGQLAVDVYNEAYDAACRRKMHSLPDGWLPEVNTITSRLNGTDIQLHLSGNAKVRIPHEKYSYGSSTFLINAPANDPLSVRWASISEELSAIESEQASIRSDIRAVLFTTPTLSKLVETWPEIRVIAIAACRLPPETNLPAPRIEILNQRLGLLS